MKNANSYHTNLQEIKKGNIDNAYLLSGENTFLKSQFIDCIETQFINPAFSSIDKLITYGDTITPDNISWLWFMPMASKKKVLIVKDTDIMLKDNKNIIPKIQNYIDNPSHTGVLLLLLNESKRQPPFKNITVCNFKDLREDEIKNWIIDFLKAKGVKIELKGIELLQELFSNDLQLLNTELDKLISFVAPATLIKLSDVETMESYELEGSIFNLTDAIGNKELAKAVRFLNLLLGLKESSGGEKPNKILWMIIQHFEKLCKVKEGHTKMYYIDKLTRQVKLWKEKDLNDAFTKLFETDFAIKTGKADTNFLLNKLIYNLCS